MRIALFFLSAVSLASPLLADHHETATKEEFREFVDLMAGRWVDDVTLIADWPGLKEARGQKVTGHAEYKSIVDGNALEGTTIIGSSVWKIVYAWDGASKKIKALSVNTGGTVSEFVVWKKSPNVFGWRATGGAMTGSGEHRFSKDGRTMELVGSNLKLDNDKLDDLRDVSTRVSPME